ncbi:hypothetical protein GCM10010121_081010 [Streptomyces brasiliensis]|uniref:Uncharacterized protein n=1 Tax=Streptomyces brasiliensis TaxID=1954 RepID=A0A917LE25_9ACTN|nr:hypothetical protein GCM10010121_081010 [Streptomyces brasiliensis]
MFMSNTSFCDGLTADTAAMTCGAYRRGYVEVAFPGANAQGPGRVVLCGVPGQATDLGAGAPGQVRG